VTPHAADIYAGAFILALVVVLVAWGIAPAVTAWADRKVAGMVHRWELAESFGPAVAYGPLDEAAEEWCLFPDEAFIDSLRADIAAAERAEFERAVRADIDRLTEESA